MWVLVFVMLFSATLAPVFALYGVPRTQEQWWAATPMLCLMAFACALVVLQAWAFGDWRCLLVRCAVTP